MKVKKGIISAMTAILLTVGMAGNVIAAEVCNISFSVKDSTENGYSGNVKVVISDTNSDKEFEYVLTRGNSWGGSNIPKYTVDGDTVYDVSFSGLKNGVKMVNQDGSEIKQFDANDDIELKWKIISISENNVTVNNDEGDENKSKVSISDKIETGNDEADEIFNDFMNDVSFIKEDEKWNSFLKVYDVYTETTSINFAQDYEDTTGEKKEDFVSMSSFDKFIYYETYIRMAKYLDLGDWERYYGSKENFYQNVLGLTLTSMRNTEIDSTVVEDAYKKLMDWQYKYIQEHKSPYNFIAGKNYTDTKKIINGDISNQNENNASKDENDTNQGIWSGMKKAVAENGISIIIALVLAGGVGALMLYRKRRNINDDNN